MKKQKKSTANEDKSYANHCEKEVSRPHFRLLLINITRGGSKKKYNPYGRQTGRHPSHWCSSPRSNVASSERSSLATHFLPYRLQDRRPKGRCLNGCAPSEGVLPTDPLPHTRCFRVLFATALLYLLPKTCNFTGYHLLGKSSFAGYGRS